MINFDAADFSERRSEEVISLFWRSVYVHWASKETSLQQNSPYETYLLVIVEYR